MSPSPPAGLLVALLLAQIAYGLFAMTLCLPSMMEWGARFQAGPAAVQLTFSGYVVAFGVLQLLYGPLSDRLGRKPVLLTGLALAAAGSALGALAPNLPVLIAARVLQGAGAAAGSVIGRALVQDLFQGPQRTRVMAWVGMALGLCPPLATVIGGQVHVRWGWQANFVGATVLALLLAWAVGRLLPAAPPRADAQGRWWMAMATAYARLARERRFVLYVAVQATTAAAFYAFLSGAPLVLGHYGVGPDGIGFYIMAVPLSYIAGNFAASRLVQRLGERGLLAAGQVSSLLGVGLVTALALAGVHGPLALALPLMLLGLGHGLLMPPVLAGMVGVLPALAGAAAAVGGLMQQLTGAAGAFSVGLVPTDTAAPLGALMLAYTLLAGVAMLLLRRA